MKVLDAIKNNLIYGDKYKTNSDAVIISCFFNPTNNPYRLKAFNRFYEDIKHLNHQIVECVIGDSTPQLSSSKNITTVYTKNTLWHKESLLNHVIANLDKKYKYVFWVDADVIFTNKNWLVDAVEVLQHKNLVQLFEYCVHLDKDEKSPSFDTKKYEKSCFNTNMAERHSKMWRSFAANYVTKPFFAKDNNYNLHGHVGFAWGAKREVLDLVPLYDRALVGGADHIIAHAAAGHIPHNCITKSFTEDIEAVEEWSRKFFSVVGGSVGYVSGTLYHIWHGDLESRQYLKRIKEFTPISKQIVDKDSNGLHVTHDDSYVRNYFDNREVKDDGFLTSMAVGFVTDDVMLGTAIGGNLTGAIIGEMLNDSTVHTHDHNQVDDNQNFS